jgi:hypothetical protein
MSMTCVQKDGFGQLQLAYSSDFGDIIEKPMGSGYSTFFAKHLACGSLPFAAIGKQYTATLVVDSLIRRGIEEGKILNFSGESYLSNMAIKTLFRMPSSTFNVIFSHAKHLDTQDQMAPTIRSLSGQWSWPRTVAGLAFGGLSRRGIWWRQ